MNVRKYNSSLSGMYGHGERVSSVTPDKQHIPRKNKMKKTSDTSIRYGGVFYYYYFSTSGILSYFVLLLAFPGSRILSFNLMMTWGKNLMW